MSEQERCQPLTRHASRRRGGERALDGVVELAFRQRVVVGDWIADEDAALIQSLPAGAADPGKLVELIHPVLQPEARTPAIEGGKLIAAVADHEHAEGLERLERAGQIE